MLKLLMYIAQVANYLNTIIQPKLGLCSHPFTKNLRVKHQRKIEKVKFIEGLGLR